MIGLVTVLQKLRDVYGERVDTESNLMDFLELGRVWKALTGEDAPEQFQGDLITVPLKRESGVDGWTYRGTNFRVKRPGQEETVPYCLTPQGILVPQDLAEANDLEHKTYEAPPVIVQREQPGFWEGP